MLVEFETLRALALIVGVARDRPSDVSNSHNAARAKNPPYSAAPNPVISCLTSSI